MKDMEYIISDELRVERVTRGYSLKEAQKLTGVEASIIHNYERNKRKMYINTIIKILNGYNIQIDIFFDKCITRMQGNEV